MIKTPFKFGERILVTTQGLTRTCIPLNERAKAGVGKREWISRTLPQPVEAIFLKGIMLSDGEVDYDYDDGWYYTSTKSYKGAWICIEGMEPAKIKLEDIVNKE